MKKILTKILTLSAVLSAGAILSACGEAKINSIYVDEEDSSNYLVLQQYDSDWNPGNLIIKARMSNGKIILIPSTDCIFSRIDCEKLGKQTLIVTYNGLEAEITIEVKETADNFTVLSIDDPDFVRTYKSVSIKQNTYNGETGIKSFSVTENMYLVGDDNAFKYSPIVLAKFENNSIGTMLNYEAKLQVELLDEVTSEFQELSDYSSYLTFYSAKHELRFNASALNKVFRITMGVEGSNVTGSNHVFKVVDGYNIYSAKELAVIDNTNADNKWSIIKANNGLIDVNPNNVIIHGNIKITKNDLPSMHFYKSDEIKKSDENYNELVGSLKDARNGSQAFIYRRTINANDTFNLEGNYFQIDMSEIPLIMRDDENHIVDSEGFTTHTTMFGFFAEGSGNTNGNVSINNLSIMGNCKKQEAENSAGGVLGVKLDNANTSLYNCIAQACYIPFLIYNGSSAGDNCITSINKTNLYDSYNTLLYCYGARNVYIDSSNFIGAGGPVMICDHVGNNESTGEGGFITNVHIDEKKTDEDDDTILMSQVVGSEGWFNTYVGSGKLVGQIKTYDKYLKQFSKTVTTSDGAKINLIAVFKSASVQGISDSIIRGSFAVNGASANLSLNDDSKYLEFASQTIVYNQVYQSAFDQYKQGGATDEQAKELARIYSDEHYLEFVPTDAGVQNVLVGAMKEFAKNGMFMQTDSGAVGFPGESGWHIQAIDSTSYVFDGTPIKSLIDASNKYIYVYLPNGMGAVLELYNVKLEN